MPKFDLGDGLSSSLLRGYASSAWLSRGQTLTIPGSFGIQLKTELPLQTGIVGFFLKTGAVFFKAAEVDGITKAEMVMAKAENNPKGMTTVDVNVWLCFWVLSSEENHWVEKDSK